MTNSNLFSLHKRLSEFVVELKSPGLLQNECTWIEFLKDGIDERTAAAKKAHGLRAVEVRDEIPKRRLKEIDEHKNVLERHLKVISE